MVRLLRNSLFPNFLKILLMITTSYFLVFVKYGVMLRSHGRIDLGTLSEGRNSRGSDINDSGQITGSAEYLTGSSKTHAIIGDKINGIMDLGTLGGTRSVGNAINDKGQVVGWSFTENDSSFASFLWESGVMYNLRDLIDINDPLFGRTFMPFAEDINSFGDIIVSGGNRSFLLSANRPKFISSVPEPTPLALLGIGLLGIGFMRKYRNNLNWRFL